MADNRDGKIPVTILTGFLGSGKTTFVNYLMKENHGHRLAIIENEFGEVGIDGGLVMQTKDEVIEMMNGCICCTVRDDLIGALKEMYKRKDKFDNVIIETTGLADPAPVAQTFFVDDDIRSKFYLDSITTFVDSKHVHQHLDEKKPDGVENESIEQVAFADVLVLNKMDLVTEEEVESLKKRLKGLNHTAKVITSTQSRVPVKEVLNIRAFDLEKTLEMDDEFLALDAEHKHDSTVSSVGFCMEGSFVVEKFNKWMTSLLREKAVNIYRSKGIVSIMGSDERYVFQAVHMLMNFGPLEEQPWGPDEKRMNRFCFIGKNLDREELTEGLKACLWDGKLPDPGEKPNRSLRFKAGDKVQVNVDEWVNGIVSMEWYRQPLWETGHYVPYQVGLVDENDELTGDYVWAPRDMDKFIRARK